MTLSIDQGGAMIWTEISNLTPEIRGVLLNEVAGVVDVHLASFQNFFLSFLGRPFLDLLYREMANESGSVFLIALSAKAEILGFAAGVPDLPAFYRRLLRERWLVFGLASVRAALLRPSIIPRLWRALGAAETANQAPCPATLMSIAVAPEAMNKGLGKRLLEAFLRGMASEGVEKICLTTDRDDNAAAIGLYERSGFRRVREYQTPEKRWLLDYLIEVG
jgi:ribosomal protein S18 acetylase RimI-like enzyme